MNESSSAYTKTLFNCITMLVLVFFFFSGMTGLIYEVLWTRMIVKIIGSSPFAVSIILTVFMGGLGIGSLFASRTIDRIKDPLKLVRIYGILELSIGAYCIILPAILTVFKPFYAALYNRFFGYFMFYSFLTFVGCGAVLIIPVICMGATLPILCRFYINRLSNLSGHAGRLYGLNTIGAALGSLLTGFWLINYLGMTGTLTFAVTINCIIGFASIIISYTIRAGESQADFDKERISDQSQLQTITTHRGDSIAALIVFAVSGFCAMAYEVMWTKLLGLIIGPTTYSFTIVLFTFITCLAIGSIFFGRLGDKVKKPIWLLIYTQLSAALLALFVSQMLGNSQFFFAKLIYHFQNSFTVLSITKVLILFLFMFLPTICLGATFPLVSKICTQSLDKVGKSIGFAYLINTIGAVLGSFCAGFLLIPLIGKENGLRLVSGFQVSAVLVIAFYLIWHNKKDKFQLIAVVILAVLSLMLCWVFPSWNREMLSFGRYHRMDVISDDLEKTGWFDALWNGPDILIKRKYGKIVYCGDGVAGFTAVLEFPDALGTNDYIMAISGKPDAGTFQDMPTQVLIAQFPMVFHPSPKTVMVLGLASGISAGEVLCYPIERLDILEISNEVVKASRFFDSWNGNVLEDPRTELIVQDGRAHLELTDRKYDVIISEPSNPWMAGLATLFTKEFFVLARDSMNQGGIFSQFIHSYQIDWHSFSMVVNTFVSVFPQSVLISTKSGDYLLIGFKENSGLKLDVAEHNFQFAQKSKNMTILNPKTFFGLVVTENLDSLYKDGEIHTDNWPKLEYAAPKAMFNNGYDIKENINMRRSFTPDTLKVFEEILPNIDAQIDFAALLFSLNNPRTDMINLAEASPQQVERLTKIALDYCVNREIDYSALQDEKIKQKCRSVQIEVIKEKLDSIEDKASAYFTLGDLCRENNLLNDAEQYYGEAIKLKPDHASLYNSLGVVLHMQEKLDEAIMYYNKALQLDPDLSSARYNLNNAQAQQKDRLLKLTN